MKEWQIHLSDWQRIVGGQLPAAFYIEIVFRCVFLFFLLIFCMRLLGKRMAAQVSRNEVAAMVSLAAAIGVSIISGEQGLLPAVIISVIVVAISRFTSKQTFDKAKAEQLYVGEIGILVEDGVLNMKELRSSRISRERVFSQLRTEQINHLGEVKRLYMEATGDFTIFRNENPAPGLMVLPSWDTEFTQRKVSFTDRDICLNCGNPVPPTQHREGCSNCGSKEFTKAVRNRKSKKEAMVS